MQVSSCYTRQVGNQWHHLSCQFTRNLHGFMQVSSWYTRKLVTNDTIFGIEKNQSVIDTTIAENCTTSAVTTIDDIEFWDWAGRTQSHSLWYWNNISNSPMLEIAVEKVLRKSCHDNMASMEFFEGITTSKIQFMGFVSQHTKQGYLSSFHPVSFVLFRTDVYSFSTVVVCTLTTHNHIQSNMQDR